MLVSLSLYIFSIQVYFQLKWERSRRLVWKSLMWKFVNANILHFELLLLSLRRQSWWPASPIPWQCLFYWAKTQALSSQPQKSNDAKHVIFSHWRRHRIRSGFYETFAYEFRVAATWSRLKIILIISRRWHIYRLVNFRISLEIWKREKMIISFAFDSQLSLSLSPTRRRNAVYEFHEMYQSNGSFVYLDALMQIENWFEQLFTIRQRRSIRISKSIEMMSATMLRLSTNRTSIAQFFAFLKLFLNSKPSNEWKNAREKNITKNQWNRLANRLYHFVFIYGFCKIGKCESMLPSFICSILYHVQLQTRLRSAEHRA